MIERDETDSSVPLAVPPAGAVRDVSRYFGSVRALHNVSVSFMPGRVSALLGENGAGKSTLVRVLSGEHQPNSGIIEIGGVETTLSSPIVASKAGVAVVHQEPQLVAERTIAENIFLFRLGEKGWAAAHNRYKLFEDAQVLLAEIGLADLLPNPREICRDLTAAERQMVEIARALALKPKLLFLDEPNSSLTRQETDRLFEVVRRLRDLQVAVVLVSHRLGEVYEICDYVVVLRDGEVVGKGPIVDLPVKEAIKLMAGERLTASDAGAGKGGAANRTASPVLSLRGLTGKRFYDINLDVHGGEIVGMAGLVGSGRTETANAVIGIDPILGGEIRFKGKPVRFRSSGQAVKAGMSSISEERRTGVFHHQDVRFNLTCTIFDKFGKLGFFSKKDLTDFAEAQAKAHGVKAETVAATMGGLSGGNQQKVLIARALASKPSLIILDEPTRGVDVRTKADIAKLLRRLAHEEGMAIWVISSEMEEILQISDRIAVMHEGTLTEMLESGPQAEKVVAAALGESTTNRLSTDSPVTKPGVA